MLEYNIDSDTHESFEGNTFKFNITRLKDGHYSLLSPCSYEVKKEENGSFVKLPAKDFTTLNTFNHYAVPVDPRDSEWYAFLDPDAGYAWYGGEDLNLVAGEIKEINNVITVDKETSDRIQLVISMGKIAGIDTSASEIEIDEISLVKESEPMQKEY